MRKKTWKIMLRTKKNKRRDQDRALTVAEIFFKEKCVYTNSKRNILRNFFFLEKEQFTHCIYTPCDTVVILHLVVIWTCPNHLYYICKTIHILSKYMINYN